MIRFGRRVASAARRRLVSARHARERQRIEATTYRYTHSLYRADTHGVQYPQSWTFPTNHLEYDGEGAGATSCPNVLYMFWLGQEEMSTRRLETLELLRSVNEASDVTFVTSDTLDSVVDPRYPLPESFGSLSAVHQSDVLRAYLMRYRGGAYVDLKPIHRPWSTMVAELNSHDDQWMTGVREQAPWNVSAAPGPMGEHQTERYFQFVSPGGFACKAESPFVVEWYDEVCRRLRYYEDLLRRHPAKHAYDTEHPYPVAWNALHGAIFTPLQLKYLAHVRPDAEARFDLAGGYR